MYPYTMPKRRKRGQMKCPNTGTCRPAKETKEAELETALATLEAAASDRIGELEAELKDADWNLQRVGDERDGFQTALAQQEQLKVQSHQEQWQPIVTAPKDEDVFFWVKPKTAEESWLDTSGNPIFSTHAPRLHRGKFGTWSSLEKASHWMPLPTPPKETEP